MTLFILSTLACVVATAIVYREKSIKRKKDIEKQANEHEKSLIIALEQEGFIGLDGAINLWNLDRKDDAVATYRQYLQLENNSYINLIELYYRMLCFIKKSFDISTSKLQLQFDINYNRVDVFLKEMRSIGVISEEHDFSCSILRPLITKPELYALLLRKKLNQKAEEKIRSNKLIILRNEFQERLLELVWIHKAALIKNHKQKIIYDDYGKQITDQWEKEKTYFLRNVVQKDDELIDLVVRLGEGYEFISREGGIVVFNEIESVIELCKDDISTPDIADINNLSPAEFEQFCANVLNDNGWTARVNGKTGDQGVDVIAERDGKIVAIQCKLYSSPIGNSSVQEVFSGMHHHHADYAAVVSNQPFTRSAKQLSATTGVILLHYSELSDLTV